MSKNSSFFKQAERQDEKRKGKISETKKKVDQYMASKLKYSLSHPTSAGGAGGGGGGKSSVMKLVDSYVREYEARRDVSSIKVVVDMDMFFAAVAIRDRPHLKDKPVAIGGELLRRVHFLLLLL
jgi:DNA polymerase kappa